MGTFTYRCAMFPLRSMLLAVSALAAPLTGADAAPPQMGNGQTAPGPVVRSGAGPSYADLADLVLAAPVIADATVVSAARIKGAEAATVAPGLARFYVEAQLNALLRGQGGLPPRVGYLVDVAPDADGHLPRLKKLRVLLFARPVAVAANGTAAGQLQLVAPDAQLAWTPSVDASVRAIAAAAVAPDAPPVVIGVGNAFHVPGSLPGESETQVFLQTQDHRLVSLSVLRRPGEQPRLAVALAEIVDEAAAAPARDTLLWYRLACALPPALPPRSTATLGEADAAAAREDYRFVIEALGPCGRRRGGAASPVSDG